MSKPNRLLISLVVTWAVMGLIDAKLALAPGTVSPFLVLYNFIMAALIYQWCSAHAAARGIEPPFGSLVLAAFLMPVGMPLYFFRTLPAFAASIATLKAVAFFIVLICVYVVAFAVTAPVKA